MEKIKAKRIILASLCVAVLGLLIILVTTVHRNGAEVTPPEPVTHTTGVVNVFGPAQVRKELSDVWFGAVGKNEGTLPRLEDSNWHDLYQEEMVVTNTNGEGWIDIDVDSKDCLRIYVFQSSKLTKAACPKSAYQSGNVVCNLEGTDAFNNTCASQVIIQTLSAEIQLEGTWLTVTYLPDQKLSLLMVLDGKARVRPVINFESQELGSEFLVPKNQFLFTMPDDSLSSIGSIAPRQPHPIELLPPIIENLDLRQWIYRIRDKSVGDVGMPVSVPPEILGVDYPAQVPSETTKNNPVPWAVRFSDRDGDVSMMIAEVIETRLESGSLESFAIRVDPKNIEGNETEGMIRLNTWCNGAVGVVKYQLTLIDSADYHSMPAEFFQRCYPSMLTPTPTQTSTSTPTQTGTSTPAPTPTPEVLVDLVNRANLASWYGSQGTLSFPGNETDARGFAIWRTNYQMEDGSVPSISLETHPSWESYGYITGYYPLSDKNIVVQYRDRFVYQVGFLSGAQYGDATFSITVNYGTYADGCGEFGCRQELLRIFNLYDGKMMEGVFQFPENIVGKNINSFTIRVDAGESSTQDWATWVTARLERPWLDLPPVIKITPPFTLIPTPTKIIVK